MPIIECQRDGKLGHKFGEEGFCYTGPDSKAKAAKQGAAIKAAQARRDNAESNARLLRSRRAMVKAAGLRLPPITKQSSRQAEGRILEAQYFRNIARFIDPYFVDIRERLIPRLPDIIEQFKSETRVDGARLDQTYGEIITKAINDIRIGIAINMTDTRRRSLADNQARSVSAFDQGQFRRQVKTAIGVDPIIDEPYLGPQISSFVERNAALIKDVPEQSVARLETKLRTGIERGDSLAKITAEVQGELRIAKNRAKLIARDQTNKFIGKLTELRQTSIGVAEYTWSTSKDERVRPEHAARDGKVYKWSDPPAGGHPGEDIQCRCRAIPKLDDLKVGVGVEETVSTGRLLIGTAIAAQTIRAGLAAAAE
jgi:SPP1 gp7 family putative phage head morphogenesis protein